METRCVVQAAVGIGDCVDHVAMRENKARGQVRRIGRAGTRVEPTALDVAALDRTGPRPLGIPPRPLFDHDCLAGPVGDARDTDRAVPEEKAATCAEIVESRTAVSEGSSPADAAYELGATVTTVLPNPSVTGKVGP